MADISKCSGHNCPLKATCYRYTATPNEHWQAYADFEFKDGACPDYWDDTGRNVKNTYKT